MSSKTQAYAQLADDTARRITGDYLEWAAFLTTSSRLYKYPYHDQLMIYAQRPDATACAAYNLWNDTMRRYIRRGSKGIALLTPGPYGMDIRYVFDVSDTGARQNSRSVNPWVLSEETRQPVRQMLEDQYYADATLGLEQQIGQIARQQAQDYWQTHARDIRDSVDGTALLMYDDNSIGASFRTAAAASISYMIQSRCGLKPELFRDDFAEVLSWNTPAAVAELGKAVSEIAGQVLRQIETTVRVTERSMNHERVDLQEERRLPSAGNGPDRNGTPAPGQVRAHEAALPEGEQTRTVHQTDSERETDGTPSGNRSGSTVPAGNHHEPAGETEQRDRRTESAGSDGLGGRDEQPQEPGGGNDPLGTDLHLSDSPSDFEDVEQINFLIPGETEQIAGLDRPSPLTQPTKAEADPSAFSLSAEEIDNILRSGPNIEHGKIRIALLYGKNPTRQEAQDYLKKEYGIGGHSHTYLDGTPGFVDFNGQGMRFTRDHFTKEMRLRWPAIERRIRGLIQADDYLNGAERQALIELNRIQDINNSPEPREALPQEPIENVRVAEEPEDNSDIDDALREWNGDIASKQAVVSYMTDHADDPDAADWLKREYGDDLPSFPVTSKDVSTDLPWSTVQHRIAQLIREGKFEAETERDALDDIDVEAVREHLERGDSSATDEMLEMAQTTQAEEPSHERFTVMETEDGYAVWDNVREAVYADEGAAPRTFPSEAQAEAYLQQVRQQVEDQVSRDWMYVECARNSVEPPKQEYAYTVGDTVYLDSNPFEIEQIGNFDVHLRDLNAVYPISRAENKQSFEAMLWSDARNAQYLPSNAQTVVPTNNMEITVSSGEAAVMEPQLAQAGIGTAKFVHEDGAVTFSFSASDQEAMEALAERIRTQLRQGPANDHNDDFQAISLERIDPDVREVLTTGLLTEQDKDAISDWFRDGEDNTVVAQRLSEMFAGNSETMQMITGEDADYFTSTSGISVEILDKYEARRSAPWDEVAAMLRTLYQQNLDGFSREQAQQEAAHPFEKGSNERQEPTVSSTTEAVYSSTQTRLPYDVVIERLHFDEPEHDAPVPASATEPVGNFHIQDEHLGEGGAKTKFSRNLEAIRTLKLIERENRTATPEEQGILSRYVGWGAMPQAFDSANREWAKEYADLQSVLNPQEYEAARASTLNAHYTSPTVIKAIYEAVKNMGFKTGNILEPSMGIGNFFGLLPEDMQGSRLYGVELDSITGRIAKQLYPNADITIAGFETTDRRDFFDLAIGNVPFGSYKVSDKRFDKYNFLIHDYFFAKALDQVRPGGLIAFVTSKGTMDKQNPEVRRYIAQRAELCGAIRLPKTAFKANAGTEVTTDILFLQKREQPMVIEPEWIHLSRTDDGIPINSYFEEHPEMVLGRMAWDDSLYGNEKETACLPFDGADLSEQLAQAVKHIIGEYHATEAPDLEESTEIQESIPADPNVKNYSYTVVDGKVYYRENSIMVSPKLNETSQERIAGMVELRNCVHRLMDAQLAEDSDIAIQALQAELNERYDTFTAKYGLINSRANAQAFRSDSSYYLLSSLEILNENGEMVRKADMFTKRTIRPKKSIDHVDTSVEALAVSIAEKAAVDLSFMSKLTGKNADEIVADLKGVIFQLPESSEENESPTYVTADEYLSGNVRQKLEKARAAAERSPVFQPNIEALEKAQPKDLDASEIDVRLGATWVDRDYIQQFMQELFDIPFYQRRSIQVQYSELTSEWRISGKSSLSYNNVANNITYGTNRANGLRILEDTLNLRDIRIYDTIEDVDGKEKRVLNQKETTLAQQKQQAIKDAFRDWIWRDADRREELTRKYNVLFNSIRPREYDGSHITFSGMNPEITLREHQRNAIAHTLYGGNTLLAHVVGAGKSATRS